MARARPETSRSSTPPSSARRIETALAPRGAALAVAAALAACGDAPLDGSTLGVPYDTLRGGIIFSTRSIVGSAGYELYWTPVPDVRVGSVVGAARLTESSGDETQPAVARLGGVIAFAASDGIYAIIGPEGRFKRITDTSGTSFVDKMPAVSPNGDRIAWVREDRERPIPDTIELYETYVMLANVDGTSARELEPRPGVIQEAPVFDPREDPRITRIAWSEWVVATTVSGTGPRDYGIYAYDFAAGTGGYLCKSVNGVTPNTEGLVVIDRRLPYRCFGQHLDWPSVDRIVITQDQFHFSTQGQGTFTGLPELSRSVKMQVEGIPFDAPRGDGFYPMWPLSSHTSPFLNVMVFDGPFQTPLEANGDTLGIWIAQPDGSSAVRLKIQGFQSDIDLVNTRNYYFSLTTPRIIPP